MIRIIKYIPVVLLCGCQISTPPLPPIDKESFSYDQLMKQKQIMEQEIEQNLK